MSRSLRAWSAAALLSLGLTCLSSQALLAQLSEPRPNASEEKILGALADKTEIEFVDQPLSDVVEYLKERHGIEIQIDEKALTEAGLGKDVPITRNIKGISLESALNLIFEQLGLAYLPRNEVLMITTKSRADELLVSKFYPVADLIDSADDGLVVGEKGGYQALIEALTASVAPTTWDVSGGKATLRELPVSEALAITQTFEGHREIERYLASLRAVRRQSAAALNGKRPGGEETALELKIYRLPAAQQEDECTEPACLSGPKSSASHEFAAALPLLISPQTWAPAGKGTVRAFGNQLAVLQTRQVHDELRRFFQALK